MRGPRRSFFYALDYFFITALLLGYYISEHVAKKIMMTAQENYKECVHSLWRAVGVDMLEKDLKETINEFMNLKKAPSLNTFDDNQRSLQRTETSANVLSPLADEWLSI